VISFQGFVLLLLEPPFEFGIKFVYVCEERV